MKKIAFLLVVIFCFYSSAFATEDWSNFSDDDLAAMIDDLSSYVAEAQAELDRRRGVVSSNGALVPVGVWTVPEDIPAGHWTINVNPDGAADWGSIAVGTALDESGKSIDYLESKYYYSELVQKKGADTAVNLEELDYDFKDGDILIVEEADMVFTPYVKPKLGF